MKKSFATLSLIITITLCCSCGPSLKSMKDADDFLVNNHRAKAKYKDCSINVYKQKPENVDAAGSGADIAAGVLTGGPVLGVAGAFATNPFTKYPKKGGKIFGAVKLEANAFLCPFYTMNRKDGNGTWDLSAEVLKRAGKPPQISTCKLLNAGIRYATLSTNYEGADGSIVLANIVYPFVLVGGNYKAEPPCMTEDLPAYDEYLDKIVNAAKDIFLEEKVRLDKAGAAFRKSNTQETATPESKKES